MAMAFSTQENEASSALRLAARMLDEAGGTFEDIAEILRQPDAQVALSVKASEARPPLPTPMTTRPSDWLTGVILERLARAEARVTILAQENETFKKQLDDAIRYIVELESSIARPAGKT